MRLTLFLPLVTSILFYSCDSSKSDSNQIESDTLLSKVIDFPSSLLLIDKVKFEEFNPDVINNDKNKLISIVDGNCSKCISSFLNSVSDIFKSTFNNEIQLIFILNVQREDSAFFMNNINPLIDTDAVIFWDGNYFFERHNNLLSEDINDRTFLIDKNNRILHYGNPILNPDNLYIYKEKLSVIE